MLAVVVFLPIGTTGAEDTTNRESEIDLGISPRDVLFDVSNIKPGDVIQRSMTITNGGFMDVQYTTKVQHTEGSRKLYNQLLLQVMDGNEVLYSGALSDFAGFDARRLAGSEKERLVFKVEFPYESGNEFQGLATKFLLRFYVKGMPGSGGSQMPNEPQETSGGFDSILPKTGEINPFLFYLVGLGMILIGLWLYRKREALFNQFFKQEREL